MPPGAPAAAPSSPRRPQAPPGPPPSGRARRPPSDEERGATSGARWPGARPRTPSSPPAGRTRGIAPGAGPARPAGEPAFPGRAVAVPGPAHGPQREPSSRPRRGRSRAGPAVGSDHGRSHLARAALGDVPLHRRPSHWAAALAEARLRFVRLARAALSRTP